MCLYSQVNRPNSSLNRILNPPRNLPLTRTLTIPQVHKFIRSVIAKKYGDKIARATVIQYGGSVKPDNVQVRVRVSARVRGQGLEFRVRGQGYHL